MDFVNLARVAWEQRDFALARMYYQKVAYGIHGTDEENKAAFTNEVAQFAGEDPLYQKSIRLIRQHIAQQQGKPVLQSDMTAFVKKTIGEEEAEQLRYVLYYAEIRKEIFRKKYGRSYLLYLSENESTQIAHDKTLTKDSKHTKFFEPNQPYPTSLILPVHSTDIAELHREATRHKNEKNWSAALSCLFKAKDLTANEYQNILQRLRLPIFLQQAGFFEAAKHELQYLLNQADHFIALMPGDRENPRLEKTFLKNLYLKHLFDKARLIYKREKQIDQATQFQELSEQYQTKGLEAGEALRQAQKKKMELYFESRQRRQAKLSNGIDTSPAIYAKDDIARPQSIENPNHEPITAHQEEQGCLSNIIGVIILFIILYLVF